MTAKMFRRSESVTNSIKLALEQIKNDCLSEKWQFLFLSTNQAIDALDNVFFFNQLPKHKLRELLLAPIQVALESPNAKLNSDALVALEAFINSDFLYDDLDGPISDTDLTFQFLDSISPCTIFRDEIQASFLKLLLKLCLSKNSRLNVNSMLRIVQICLDLNLKYVATGNKENASLARATLVQTIEAFVIKSSVLLDGQVDELSSQSSPKFVYNYLFDETSMTSELSDPQLQILGVLKCLIESILPENMHTLNRIAVPLYLQAIAAVVSRLPVSMVKQRVFLKILWQRMCPMLMWFLSNPKLERNITSTSDLHSPTKHPKDQQTIGMASSVAPPILWPEGLNFVYEIVVDLAYLVGPIGELRPMLESLFHKMLLYPPPIYRRSALNAICRLLGTPEGLLSITGPVVSIPLRSDNGGDCLESSPIEFGEPQMPDSRIFNIILESVYASSETKDQALVCTSAKCINLISATLGKLIHCESLSDSFVRKIKSQLHYSKDNATGEENKQEISKNYAIQNAALPRSLEVDRWAAHDYLLSLTKAIPSFLDAQSIIEVDNLLLEFSSAYCKELRSSVSGGVLSPSDPADFADETHVYDASGTLLNADAVYVATVSALALNYRLLQAGFYSSNSKNASNIMTESAFLDSILGAGLMLYVSETWLSQVYRGIRHQDILSASGLPPKLLHGPMVRGDSKPLRGACLVEMLIEFDGIGWTYEKAVEAESSGVTFEMEDKGDDRKIRERVGELLVSRILLAGWQRIVETLANTLALAGMRVDISSTAFSFFAARQTSAPSAITSKENIEADSSAKESGSKSLLQTLLSLFYITEAQAINHSAQLRELGSTLSASLHSLQQLAGLASVSSSEALRVRCGAIFALLTETARAALVATTGSGGYSALPPNRLHPAHALGIHVVLTNALRLGCHSPDCWLHLLNACQLIRDMEHVYLASMYDAETTDPELNKTYESPDLRELIQSFCEANAGLSDCLTLEQTEIVLSALSAQVDQIFDTAADVLSLPALVDFIYCILQASGAELAARSQRHSTTPESKHTNNLRQAIASAKDKMVKVAKRQIIIFSGVGKLGDKGKSIKSQGPTLFLDRLSQLLLRVIRSPKRPLLHLLRAWVLVSQHLVDACCFSSPSFEFDAERLLVSQRALTCLHECTVNTITTRLELPYFNSNEMFCKPFEILLRLEMCDGELQDRIINCISEVVESCNSALHSGWRPIFAGLRSIKVPFLAEVNQPDQTASSQSVDTTVRDQPCPTCSKVEPEVEVTQMQEIHNRKRISTVLEVLEIFLFTDDILVFCNIAVDCVRCLLRYLSSGRIDYIYTDIPPHRNQSDTIADNYDGSADEQTQTANKVDATDEASYALCKATLPLLRRCCEILGYLWASDTNESASAASLPTIDHILRSAKRQAHQIAGGPPQLNLLPSVRSFTSPILHDRIKNLAPWFTTGRFFEPSFHSENPVDPDLCTLRSLDDIDQPSGVLHLWFLTLEGIIMAIWDCNPRAYWIVFEEFVSLLNESAKICGEKDVPTSRLTDGIEREEIKPACISIGPSFAVFVVNHALLPRLQIAVSSNALTGGINDESELDFIYSQSPLAYLSSTFKKHLEESIFVSDIRNDSVVLSKLSFIISQTTQLICSLIIRYQQDDMNSTGKVVGMNLMLHQFLSALVDCISVRNERTSRLAASCLRHLLISTAPYLTVHQWEIAIIHLEEAFRACLFPVHTLTTVSTDRAKRSLSADAGLQLVDLRPISATNQLRQLALRLFQLPEQLDEEVEKARDSSNEDETGEFEQPCYSFGFKIFPLCTHEVGRLPLIKIPLSLIISSLVNTSLLIHILGELLLSSGEVGNPIPKSVQKLLIFESSLCSNVFDGDPGTYKLSATGLKTLEFFTRLPLRSGLQLLNCLADSYTAFFEFDQCEDMKKLIQRLLKLQSPANLYQFSHLTLMALQILLLQIVQNGLAANCCSQLSEQIKTTFVDFDENILRLRVDNFRRLPLQVPVSTTRGEFVSPLPWLKPLVPDKKSQHKFEQFANLLSGLSTHLTQFYLYLLDAENRERSDTGPPIQRSESTNAAAMVYPVDGTMKLSEPNPNSKSRVKAMLSSPRRFMIDASTTTTLLDMNKKMMRECLTEDKAARIASLTESLAILPEGFLALSIALETAPTHSPPASSSTSAFAALENVFIYNVARLIAVAEHKTLRRALATWFLRLVQNQKSSI